MPGSWWPAGFGGKPNITLLLLFFSQIQFRTPPGKSLLHKYSTTLPKTYFVLGLRLLVSLNAVIAVSRFAAQRRKPCCLKLELQAQSSVFSLLYRLLVRSRQVWWQSNFASSLVAQRSQLGRLCGLCQTAMACHGSFWPTELGRKIVL